MVVDLDKIKYQTSDPQDMFGCLKDMPQQCRKAWDLAGKFKLPDDFEAINKVVILGMGGSAIGGDLVGSLALSESVIPIIVVRDYNLPACVDEKTLVVANSYSGNTEETLSAFGQALKNDCKKLAITTGGKLARVAELTGTPVFKYEYPSQPRAALSWSLLPLLCFLQKLGVVKDKNKDVKEAVDILTKLQPEISPDVATSANPAKQLAWKVYGNIPFIYGAENLSEVAHRWKTQINENAKGWAVYENFPELNHNAVVGYTFPAEVAGKAFAVMLRSASANERITLRQEITRELLERAGVQFDVVNARGKSALAQMLGLVLYGDYVSCYLAMLYGVDPTPVPTIDILKKRLSGE